MSSASTDAGDGLAARLRRALVPPDRALMTAAGLDIAVRYRAADPGRKDESGDWYDVFPMADGDLILVVGDVAGHGEAVVVAMERAREALRARVVAGASPGELLSQLNIAAINFSEDSTGTVICGRYDPRSRVLRWARAGHLPPVLVRDGSATVLDMPEGMLLGVSESAIYAEQALQLLPGDMLLLYTDGLIEKRAGSIGDALEEFAASVVHEAASTDDLADHIMAAAASDTGDDACLLAIQVEDRG
jgi:serine phosphatase RsbU (regulator of sigma subunit)